MASLLLGQAPSILVVGVGTAVEILCYAQNDINDLNDTSEINDMNEMSDINDLNDT
ncbi:MAG: hypothetical protein NTZ04_01500 [Chloroflexi bacterium]|nr:hypothetical protein [Chloroflexota bacterium]